MGSRAGPSPGGRAWPGWRAGCLPSDRCQRVEASPERWGELGSAQVPTVPSLPGRAEPESTVKPLWASLCLWDHISRSGLLLLQEQKDLHSLALEDNPELL